MTHPSAITGAADAATAAAASTPATATPGAAASGAAASGSAPAAPVGATPATAEEVRRDPLRFGVGARLTISVMTSDYAPIILGALDRTDLSDLQVSTGDVSTWLGGDEAALLRALTDLADAIAATGEHASISLLLSRGCPGEAVCEAPGGAGPRAVPVPVGRRTGQFATADWCLYPLADGGPDAEADHMRAIYGAIEHARSCGIDVSTQHFATRLAGDLGLILETVVAAWVLTGHSVQHVTSHLTVSINSPSHNSASHNSTHRQEQLS